MAGELKIDVRRKKILEVLRRDGQVRVSQLSDTLGATVVTIRNDLDALEQDGYLERTQGGAIQTMKNYYNLEFQRRKQEHMELKKAIASAAARLVRDGDTLFINSGTTTYFTAVELKQRKNLNVVTNSISVAVELGGLPTFRVILLGGDISAQYSFTYGEDVKEQISRYRANWAILSVDGVNPGTGVTTYHAEESVIDRIMMERAEKALVVADSTKLGRESFSRISALSSGTILITDHGADPALTERISGEGVEVQFV
ncbi:MAG: DeoR/GlpR family DNA-binding transcription regulator [Eubacteriales bacterium]|nr:DeoR/GlpR family DNA-binding transcription regulator [Eubacteriales bacterium]